MWTTKGNNKHTKSACAHHEHEEPQHAWMHEFRHMYVQIYGLFGRTDENKRKIVITAGTQK